MAEDKKKDPKAAVKPAAKKKEKATKAYKTGKNCPKCGPGTKLAAHANRHACGKCGYFEKK